MALFYGPAGAAMSKTAAAWSSLLTSSGVPWIAATPKFSSSRYSLRELAVGREVVLPWEELQPVRMGSSMVAPYGSYTTADQQTVVLGTTSDREWRRLARDWTDVTGRVPALGADTEAIRAEVSGPRDRSR